MVAPIVFFSHDSHDERVAALFATTLSNISLDQVKVWFSSDSSGPGGCKPGSVWLKEIESRLKHSDIILVLVTPISIKRPWIYFETGYGFSHGSQIIPICFGIDVHEVPLPLSMFQCYALNDLKSLTQFCKKLFDLVGVRFDQGMASSGLRKAAKLMQSLLLEIRSRSSEPVSGFEPTIPLKICAEALATAWEDLPIPIHRIDETGVICGVNKKWVELFQYQPEEVLGKPAHFLMTAESAQLAMLVVIPEFWERGFCENVSYEYKRKDGTVLNVVLNCIATTDKDGRKASLSFVRPVFGEARKQARQRSTTKYRQKLSKRKTGFYEMDLLGNFTAVNPYMCRLLGYDKRSELLEKNFRDVMDPESANTFYKKCHVMYTNDVLRDQCLSNIRTTSGLIVPVRIKMTFLASNGLNGKFRGTVEIVETTKSNMQVSLRAPVSAGNGTPKKNRRVMTGEPVRRQ